VGNVGFDIVVVGVDFLRHDDGVHRLVRVSPFDTKGRRHTSFAAVRVDPVPRQLDAKLELAKDSYRVDTYRASGAGGQHVNTTDSAVRLTHLASGIVAQSQNERSQHQNRRAALELLTARVLAHTRQQQADALAQAHGSVALNSFGSDGVVRTYQLHPETRVRCHVSNLVASDVAALLTDGELEPWWRAVALARLEQSVE
jgi:peptide chain release factor 2